MPIQIIDNFNLTLAKPIDNRFVVGSQSFYTTKDSIGYKYPGMRIWDLNDGIPYVWTGTTFSSESSVSISGSGTPNYLAKFNSSNIIDDSLLFDDGANIGISETSPSHKLDVNGVIRAQSGFTGDGSLITNINASSITSGNLSLARIQLTPGVSGNILLHAGGSAQWVSPSSLSVGTASALQTTRTIWGQNFNGTGNITGNMRITYGGTSSMLIGWQSSSINLRVDSFSNTTGLYLYNPSTPSYTTSIAQFNNYTAFTGNGTTYFLVNNEGDMKILFGRNGSNSQVYILMDNSPDNLDVVGGKGVWIGYNLRVGGTASFQNLIVDGASKVTLSIYADNAAATSAGLSNGTLYRKSTGEVMVKY